jgi:hypothetical protein
MPVLAKELSVRLRLDARYDVLDSNVGAYVRNDQTAGWELRNSTYKKETGELWFSSNPGIFSAISRPSPATPAGINSQTMSMLNVHSSLAITDLAVFNPSQTASSNQLINVLNAIAEDKKQVAVNQTPSQATITTLQRSGMFVSAGAASVPREQAVASMIRLYELKTKQQIRPSYNLNNTPYTDTRSAAAQYHTALLKAAEINMLSGNSARPKAALTLGELFELAEVVILDAGL